MRLLLIQFSIAILLLNYNASAQSNSANGNCYNQKSGTYLEIGTVLAGIRYLGGSERIELEISGGNYHSFGKHVFLIDSRDGLNVIGYQDGQDVPGYNLRIFDNGNAINSRDKYVLGIEIPEGSWRSICVRAREIQSKKWLDITPVAMPSLPLTPFLIEWRYKSYKERFEVNGTIRSKEVKVEASPWPDYVFEDSYQLKDLAQVADFISLNGHLPNIPSAREVEKKGIALGEMNAKLLEKIEELTLYLINQEAKSKSQEKTITDLIKKVNALESKISSTNN